MMIGPANPNLPQCHSCGAEGAPESFVLYRLELVCAGCYEDHEAKAAAEDATGEDDTLPGVPSAAWDAFEKMNRALPPDEQRD